MKRALLIVALVFALRLPFLSQAIQGDDLYYLYGAQHAQIDPLHPLHTSYLFNGTMVDMRGHSHPPLNSWVLGALLAIFKDVREVPFHLAYTLFSIIAALAADSLARRYTPHPWIATLAFLAVPAFVVNGNSLESDLPFLAFWTAAIALFVWAVETASLGALVAAAAAAALAGLAAYQAVMLTPVLAVFLFSKRSAWRPAWIATLAAPAALAAWQIFERTTGGATPAAVLSGYITSYGFRSILLRGDAALVAHLGWMIAPLMVIAAAWRGPRWRFAIAGIAAIAAALYDPNPMFWLSIACGVLLLLSCLRMGFLEAWALLFFAAALVVFFAGSARYLLPIAAPLAILVSRTVPTRIAAVAIALQFAIAIGLAAVNFQHWGAYRVFTRSVPRPQGNARLWINGDWGLRFYLESEGGVALSKTDAPQPGDIIVTSELSQWRTVNAKTVPLASIEIAPAIPLRMISLTGRSGYSIATRGLRAFEFSTAAVDRVRAELVVERKPALTWVTPQDRDQIMSGWYPDGWMEAEATVLIKRANAPLKAGFLIPQQSPARRVEMWVDGKPAAAETFSAPGNYTLSIPPGEGADGVTVTLKVDRTFSVPPDKRNLGMLVTGVGFQ